MPLEVRLKLERTFNQSHAAANVPPENGVMFCIAREIRSAQRSGQPRCLQLRLALGSVELGTLRAALATVRRVIGDYTY
jgi:hypothetical protein